MANEPLQGLPVAVGSVTVSVYPCTGDCSAAVMAFVQELTAGSATPEIQEPLTNSARPTLPPFSSPLYRTASR